MLTIVPFVLSFVASTLAYSVITPNQNTKWLNKGSKNITFERVNTDSSNFSIYLVNQVNYPPYSSLLAALVQGGDKGGSAIVNAPSGGWTPASGYQINLQSSDPNSTQIYVQSDHFDIVDSDNSTTSSGSTTANVVVPTASTSTTGATGTSDSSDSATILPTSSNSAALSYSVQTGLLGLFSLLGFALA